LTSQKDEAKEAEGAVLCAFSFNYHDSSVAVSRGKEVLLILEAERVFRRKKLCASPDQMADLINIALREVSASPDDVMYWATTNLRNPWVGPMLSAEGQELADTTIDILGAKRPCLVVGHHRSHAASFFLSGLDTALVSTCDGGGDDGQLSGWYLGKGISLERVDQIDDGQPVSGLLYRYVSDFLFGQIHCEGKLMALAAFGQPDEQLMADLMEVRKALRPFDVEDGFTLLKKLIGDRHGQAVSEPLAVAEIASSLQACFESGRAADIERHSSDKACGTVLAGGACLNIGANRRIFDDSRSLPYIPPCCDDTGQALGALGELIVRVCGARPSVGLPYTGHGTRQYPAPDDATIRVCAEHIARGGILLVHNGAAEIGPRALGHRSFLARATSMETKKLLSEEVKQREWYRPVAPVVREADCSTFFVGPPRSDFMLFRFNVRPSWHAELTGCVHADGSARVQTLPEGSDPFLEALLARYGQDFGPPVLLNTSLNLRGEPLADDIEDCATILRRMPVGGMLVHDSRITSTS
jgi:carbamoyltransferase